MTETHDWLHATVAKGAALLYALALPGRPAADDLKLTVAAMTRVLRQNTALDAHDQQRLARAFERLAGTVEQWPSPALVIRALNAQPRYDGDRLALLPPEDPERTARALAELGVKLGVNMRVDESSGFVTLAREDAPDAG